MNFTLNSIGILMSFILPNVSIHDEVSQLIKWI
jgi:hypothetical protein